MTGLRLRDDSGKTTWPATLDLLAYFDQRYIDTAQCLNADPPPPGPLLVLTGPLDSTLTPGASTNGVYHPGLEIAYLNVRGTTSSTWRRVSQHEFTHHVLFVTTGDGDGGHAHPSAWQCQYN